MKTKKFSKLISRRDVLRYMALGGAGMVATACGAAATPEVVEKIVTVEVEKEVQVEVEKQVLVTPTAAAMATYPGANLEMIMRRSFIPEMNAIQENQIAQWAESHQATVEPTFAKDWRELMAAAVETKSGGDIAEPFQQGAHIYGENLADLSDLAEALGEKYGGWYEVGKQSAIVDGVWRAIPRAYTAHAFNYRTDVFSEVGYEKFPTTYDEYLDAATKIFEAGLPPVGNSISQAGPNDSASFCYSLLWSYGAMEVEEDGKTVAINSDATRAALKYAQQLAKVSAADITAYDEGSNNRNFLAGDISCTQNATSIYWAAQKQAPDIADNMSHARYPEGPAGHQQLVEMNLLSVFDFSPNKDAAIALVTWLMDEAQLAPLAQVGITFYTPLLSYYDDLPQMPWNTDPKLGPLKGLAYTGHLPGWPGPPSRQSAEAYANQSLVNMFARVVTGEADIEEAVKVAEDELKSVYEG
ncbi:MAG: extracellular solute-binding protein [Chloroflexi bacterium]|nr:MAG: extracellular solute-binding protein [Chloroflexota bacterium]